MGKRKGKAKRPGRWRTLFPGITRAARSLGVTRPHLYMVLTGRRESRRLTVAYREWKRAVGA